MSGQEENPNVPYNIFTPFRPIPHLPADTEQFVNQLLTSPPPRMELGDSASDPSAPAARQQPRMELTEERFLALQALAERQAKQIEDGNAFANQAAVQLQESQRQLEVSQRNLSDLTAAFNSLSTQGRPLTVTAAPKKKPDLPAFDSKNILIWIRRVEAAYLRAGVVDPKDKFAWLEGIFQVKLDPQIDAYLYGSNTAQDWADFIAYLKLQYGPTIRQKAQKLMGEVPRHELKPSQWLLQLKEDVKDVEIDHILKEHLLKTIPPRIRKIMGKEVENMSSQEVAKLADDFFDRQGKPIERQSNPVNNITTASSSSTPFLPSSSSSSSAAFTQAYSDDDDTDVNFVKKGGFRGNERGRFNNNNNRGSRSKSRSNFNRFPNSSSTPSSSNDSQSSKPNLCRWHRMFGDKSRKCVTDCSKYKAFTAAQSSGNGQGGRRM